PESYSLSRPRCRRRRSSRMSYRYTFTVGALRRAAQSLVGASNAISTSVPCSMSVTSWRSASSISWITACLLPAQPACWRGGANRQARPGRYWGARGCPYGQVGGGSAQQGAQDAGEFAAVVRAGFVEDPLGRGAAGR